jgi:tetratricopeptide (TPR) repeat protein
VAAPAERPRNVGEASRAKAGERTEAPRGGPPPGTPPSGARPQGSSGKRPAAAIALALLLLAVATAVVIASTLSGDDGDGAQNADSQEQRSGNGNGADKPEKAKAKPKKDKTDKQGQQAQPAPAEEQAPAEEAPAEEPAPAEPTPEVDPARGAALNDQGFARMQQGDYAGAVPLLQQAVASYPDDTQDIGYAYALFNLGKSLNRSGRADEAIPYLEERLRWPDQRATVQQELDLARRNAG